LNKLHVPISSFFSLVYTGRNELGVKKMKFENFPTSLLVKCSKKVAPDAVTAYFSKSSPSFLQRQHLLHALREAKIVPTDESLTPILAAHWDKIRNRFYTPERELIWKNDHVVLTSQARQYVKKILHVIDERWTVSGDQQISYQGKTSPILSKEDISFFHAYSSHHVQNHPYLVRFCTELISFSSQLHKKFHYVHSVRRGTSRWEISFCLPSYPDVVLTALVDLEFNELLKVKSPQLRAFGLTSLFPAEDILHFVKEEAPTRLEMLFQ